MRLPTQGTRDVASIPGLGRSPGAGKRNPLKYSCLENPMDRGAWQATVHEVTKSQTRLGDWTYIYCCYCCSVAKLCLILCDPMNCSTPGFFVLYYLPEFAQTHVWDAIQPSHPLVPFSSRPQSFPASGSFPVSWLFISGGRRIGGSASASVLPITIQGLFPLRLTHLISSLSKGLSRVFSSTTVQKCQFFGAQPSLCSNSHICTWLLEKP